MSSPLTEAEKLRRLPWSYAHWATNSIFAQLTVFGTPFILFLDALGLPNTQIGFLLSFLPFFSLVAVFFAPLAARFGLKRIYLIFWGTRKFVTLLLLFTPYVLARYGPRGAEIPGP